MKQGSAAKRYASALLQVAQEQGKVADFDRELQGLAATFRQNSALSTTLSSPVVPPSKKKAIGDALLAKLGVSSNLRNLIHILIDNERVSEIPLLALIYRDMADELEGRVRVQVISAAPLAENEAKLQSILEKTLKQQVILETKVDPQVLGGLVVRVQDRVFDASLKGELERWKESLSAEAVA
ncbi:MAG TPA: ATP synthase F1 subunit delta [bacterium]|nr:ATP synthase F1 subunit delta [bacterium]